MNPELQEFLTNSLTQIIAGVPIGTILSLVIYYALNKVKAKTSEFPKRASDLEMQVKNFKEEAISFYGSTKKELVELVSTQLNDFNKKADEYKAVIENYRKKLEVNEKQTATLVAQNEIVLDVLKVFIGENKTAVINGIAKNAIEKINNYKEHAYLAQDVINSIPEIKEKVIFLVNNYPDNLLESLVNVPIDAMEKMVEKYEKEKSQS